jgi:hypothetical protein
MTMPRMHVVTLEAFRDESTGELGLGIVGMPRDETTNAAGEGLLIAHDLIEHVNGAERIGSIDDELEALGAIWYVRGQHGELNRTGAGSRYSIEKNIASDVVRMFRDHLLGSQWVDYANLNRTRPCDADEALLCVLEHAERDYIGEFNDDAEERRQARDAWPKYRRLALHRMRTGYRKARRKWEPRGRYAANSQFWAIAEAVDKHAKHVEIEGQRYTLRWGYGEAYCEETYDEEDY